MQSLRGLVLWFWCGSIFRLTKFILLTMLVIISTTPSSIRMAFVKRLVLPRIPPCIRLNHNIDVQILSLTVNHHGITAIRGNH